MNPAFCVVGSGPAGVAAAMALARSGASVTMLDAGREIEESRTHTVARMRSRRPEDWDPADVAQIREGVGVSARGIPLKRLYGSDFAFDTRGSGREFEYRDAGVRPSFARGGLSNVWGAGMMPFDRDDISDWPFRPEELDPGYREVLSFVPSTESEELRPSRQGEALLRDAARSKEALAAAGIAVERSRLAVRGGGCARCGLCLYGCPYGLIYNSGSTLAELMKLANFRYEPGFVVERVEEAGARVRILGHDLKTRERREMPAGRVFLGAGTIPSTAILLESLEERGARIRLQDSFYFLVPLLRFAGIGELAEEPLHTLSQVFITMRDEEVSRQLVHFSVYGFNDLTIPALRASVGALGAVEEFYSRAMVAGGYLHSALSPGLSMTVEDGRVLLEGEDSAAAIGLARKAVSKLARQALRLRALAVPRAVRFFPPGRGYHTGGSFPMRAERVPHTSDIDGRPHGFERVHLVDASCLPSIPATTITLPVMANAWRIAGRALDA
ncbi:MAG: GMC family oxidoreductase [Acidobacteriota bacterium]|nr:GMC family oxidoreductase [Acidobacteriota bacterium]